MADDTKKDRDAASDAEQEINPTSQFGHEFGVITPSEAEASQKEMEKAGAVADAAAPVVVVEGVSPVMTMPKDPNPIEAPIPLAAETPLPSAPSITASQPQEPSQSALPDTPQSQGPAQSGNFSKLLDSIKLPERHDFKGSADVKMQPVIAPAEPKPAARAEEGPKPDHPIGMMEPENRSSIVSPVHTLKDDLQGVVREKKISLVRAVALEQEKKRGQERVAPQRDPVKEKQRRHVIAIVFAALLLFALGGAALFGVYYIMQQRSGVTEDAQQPQSSLMFAESTVTFSLDNQGPDDLKNALAQARGRSLGTLGSITRIIPVFTPPYGKANAQQAATLSQFLSAIGAHPPDQLMRALGDDFFFGMHVVDKNSPVLVIPVSSYDSAFAGMLAWENTMNADLAPIFTAVPALKAGTNGLPTQRVFQDVVLRNYDTRALEDDSGQIQLYYAFPNPTILVIAESPYSFAEILSRLQAARKL